MKMIWIFELTNCTFFVNVSQLHAQLNLDGKSNRPVYVFKYFPPSLPPNTILEFVQAIAIPTTTIKFHAIAILTQNILK